MRIVRFLTAIPIVTMTVIVLSAELSAQHRNRSQNLVLLGVVTEPVNRGLRIMHVLQKSPAAKAKLAVGDVITHIDERRVKTNWNLDDFLRHEQDGVRRVPGERIDVRILRGKKKKTIEARLIARKKYKGDFLERRRTGTTGFDAPEWFAYAWNNTGKSRPAPTRENTSGKVVVFHTFQSW